MAVQTDGNAPYAPPATVMDVINRFRDRGLATPFTLEVLTRAGVTDALAPRVLQTLKLLDLVDGSGEPTPEFEGLRRASTADFPTKLEEVLRTAYAEVFNFVDPSQDTLDEVTDAFRSFKPPGQRGRMVTLFLGLCKEAGIIESNPSRPRAAGGNGTSRQLPSHARRRPAPATPAVRRAKPKPRQGELPPQLQGLLDTLPDVSEGWTKARRDQFITAFSAIIDYTYPLREQLPPGADPGEGEG